MMSAIFPDFWTLPSRHTTYKFFPLLLECTPIADVIRGWRLTKHTDTDECSLPSDLHSLRWPDYHAALVSTFRRLREEEDFVDVTLACNGRKNFTAHKVVLSACSPYFKQLLKVRAVPKHPLQFV